MNFFICKLKSAASRCALVLGLCLGTSIPAVAGGLSDPVVMPPAGMQHGAKDCIKYIDDIVWWDHGTKAFIDAIQQETGANRATAMRLSRQYCRELRLGNPAAQRNLDAGIEAIAIMSSN